MRAHAARSALLLGTAQAYKVGLNFFSNVLLARLLTPKDFGLVAMASTVVAFVALAQDLGLNQVTIQRPEISQQQISALFWTTSGVSVALAALLALLAPLAGTFYDEPRVATLIGAFALLVVLNGSQSQLLALLNRDLRFKAIAAIDIFSATVGSVVGVYIAWRTASYWALFASGLASGLVSSLVSFACAWKLSDFRPIKPSFEGRAREYLSFGVGVFGFNIVNYFARNADNVLIGKVYGGEVLGYYDRAYRLLLFPLDQLRHPLGRIMVPALSRVQGDPIRYRNMYLECISLMMMITQPGLVVAILYSSDVFAILFGPHWSASSPIFQWLGVCSLHQIMTATVGWLYLSQGRSGDFFKIGLFNAITAVASFVVGLSWGPVGVAAAYTISDYTVRLPVTLWWTCRKGPVATRDVVLNAIPHVSAIFVTFAVLELPATRLSSLTPLSCITVIVLSYLAYGTVMAMFPDKRRVLGVHLRSIVGMLPAGGARLKSG